MQNRNAPDWKDVLDFHQMKIMILNSCDVNENDRRRWERDVKDSHPAYTVEAIKKLVDVLGFLRVDDAGNLGPTQAGLNFLRTYTPKRTDIRHVTNQVVIE
jgi:hypothetical protein